MSKAFTYIFFLLLIGGKGVILGQDLEKIGKKDALKINGGITTTSIFYDAKGISNRRQPFTYFVNGNITANIIGISLPFTFNYSNNKLGYAQPYNIQSFNPTYKWVKGYAGITSMNFSQYTQAGHIFTGGGLELSPKSFKAGILYGRFRKATEFDFVNNSDLNMSYKRNGWGGYFGYEKNGHGIKLIYFGAKDDPYSLKVVPVNTNIKPMANAVVSLAGKTTLFKILSLEAEYALSGITRDLNYSSELSASVNNKLPVIFKTNGTSQFFSAYKTSLGYRFKDFNLNLLYERVDPGYTTLGAYYFNNDLENITIAPSLNLLKGKLNLSANTGIQKNNLNNEKLNTTKRWVGSINVNYSPNKSWSIGGNYSNFTSYTKQRPQSDPFYKNTLDTLNFYQIAQNASSNVLYMFGNNNLKQNTSLSANYQVTGQNQGAVIEPGPFGLRASYKLPSKVLNLNVAHTLFFTKSKTSLTPIFNFNQNLFDAYSILYYGPGLNFSKSVYKDLIKISAGSLYNSVNTNNKKTSEILSHRLAVNYSPKWQKENIGKLNLSLSTTFLQKLAGTVAAPPFNEFTGTFTISYNF